MWRGGGKYLYLWHVLNKNTWSVALRIVSQVKWVISLFYRVSMLIYVKIAKFYKFCMELRAHVFQWLESHWVWSYAELRATKGLAFFTLLTYDLDMKRSFFVLVFVLVMGQYKKLLSKFCPPTCETGAFEIFWSYRIIPVLSLENFLRQFLWKWTPNVAYLYITYNMKDSIYSWSSYI